MGQCELQGSLCEGEVNVFGFAVRGFELDGGVSLEGNKFFVEGESESGSRGDFEGVLCDQSIDHILTRYYYTLCHIYDGFWISSRTRCCHISKVYQLSFYNRFIDSYEL